MRARHTQVAGIAAEELGRQQLSRVASMTLMPNLQLHLGRGHSGNAGIASGDCAAHEVHTVQEMQRQRALQSGCILDAERFDVLSTIQRPLRGLVMPKMGVLSML